MLKQITLFDYKSIMGVSVPVVEFQSEKEVKPDYGFANTSVELDQTFKQFQKILELIADLAMEEGATFQIANDVRRTQRRVNAFKLCTYSPLQKYCKIH